MKDRFFEIAIKLAEKSTHPQHRFGCALVKKNKVISIGFNQLKTHPKSKSYGNYLHAEIHTLLGVAAEDLRGAVLYVARVRRCGGPGYSRPCEICMHAIQQAGIKTVFFFDELGNRVSMRV